MRLTELFNLIKKDIERWYFYANIQRKASYIEIIKNIFNPRFMPVFLYRLSHFFYKKRLMFLAKIFSMINFIIFGIEITIKCEIGPGLIFPHTQGTVIGSIKIGKNALIYHGVTIGAQRMDVNFDPTTRPIIGDNVIMGAGSKILGAIHIGNNVTIGANAVVINDVKDNTTVVGIPAREIEKSKI